MKYQVATDIAVRKLEDEIFFVTPKTSEIHSLNDIGVLMWDLLLQNRTFENIGEILSEQYDASAEQITDDARALASELLSKGILIELED